MPWNALTAKDAFFSNSSVHAFQADPALVKKGEIQSRRYQFYHIIAPKPRIVYVRSDSLHEKENIHRESRRWNKESKVKTLEVELHFLQTDRRI